MSLSPELMKERLVEAARYALVRRLAPAIRHDMAGVLQPIGMMAAMLEKRLQKPTPDMMVLATNSASIGSMSREAAASCMRLMTWIAPKDNAAVPAGASVAESIGLLYTELSFRGFSIVNQCGDLASAVLCSVVRNVFMGSLIALTDSSDGPAQVVLTASHEGHTVKFSLVLEPVEGESVQRGLMNYRCLDWDDVAALAEAEGVELTYNESRADIVCPSVSQP